MDPSADRTRKPEKMRRLWEKFGIAEGAPLFQLMRLTLPHLDTVRPQYRLKQKSIAKMYVEILAIPESSDDAQMLLNWKKPASGFQRNEQVRTPASHIASSTAAQSRKAGRARALLLTRVLIHCWCFHLFSHARTPQGNFPEVVHAVIKDRYPKRVDMPEKPLTIGELNNMLDKLADEDGFANKKAVLHSIAVRATAREQRWST